MFGLGPVELAIVGAVIFMIFGGGIMKRFAKGIQESKQIVKELGEVDAKKELS